MSAEAILDRFFKKRVIVNCERDAYLLRWYIFRSAPIAIFIHKFIRSDEDRALHDHPWNFLVIPVWRGYYEHSAGGKRRVLPILGTRFRRGTYRHRVELIKPQRAHNSEAGFVLFEQELGCAFVKELPSWSIFVRFREFREWGFWMPEGWIQWNRWWQDKCE